MRKVYSLLIYLALPLILIYISLRGFRDRDWLSRWNERFARFSSSATAGGIVIHAASFGEVNAAAPLVTALLRERPDIPLTVTTFTPTGSRRVRALFGGRVQNLFSPIDLPGAVGRFFRRLQPRLFIVMETEIWPNLFTAARQAGIPAVICNARLSASSVRGYGRMPDLVSEALGGLVWVGAQSQGDAERLVSCGASAERTEVTGNIKFDLSVSPGLAEEAAGLRARWGAQRPVLTAGSTRPGDEEVLLPAFKDILERAPDALLILVPRHPERFSESAKAARASGLRVALRSDSEACPPDTQCFVIDTMGELMRYYACSDVAFVGGTFADVGGHNPVEPAALGKPVLFGPFTRNIETVAEQLEQAGAGRRLVSGDELSEAVLHWFADTASRERAGAAARALAERNRGSLERHLQVIYGLLKRT